MVHRKFVKMERNDKIIIGSLLAVTLFTVFSIYTTNLAVNAPHEEDVWIQTCYDTTDYVSGVNITQIVTRNSGILYYAGHYARSLELGYDDIEDRINSGNYTIYSEGKPGWLYRKITAFEIRDQDTT